MRYHRQVVPRLHSVVHDQSEVPILLREQDREHPLVELHPQADGQRVLHRPASQLVPERHRTRTDLEHTEPLGFGEVGQFCQQRTGQWQLDARGHDSELLEHPLSCGVEPPDPGEHGTDNRRWHGVVRCGKHLGHDERITLGKPVQRR